LNIGEHRCEEFRIRYCTLKRYNLNMFHF
jgi:hypothetical protein